ncbi:MAG: hypothetical protein P1V81_04995 [Planctomycetota bacterium]|nr:hypothetical protein [Planctomycetota bacterium]
MGELFECAWEELRPAPRVTIDFQNGHVLERTLNGNVATLFCTPGGRVYDVLPGIMDPEVYAAQLQESAERFRELPVGGVGRFKVQLDSVRRASELRDVAAAAASPVAYIQDFNIEIAKGASEFGIKEQIDVVEPAEPDWFLGQGTAGKGVVELPIKAQLGVGTPGAGDVLHGLEQSIEEPLLQDFDVDVGKFEVESPVKVALAVPPPGMPPIPGLTDFDRANLALDTASLFDHVLPDALDLLAARPLCRPEELTPLLFREVLHVDLEDPFLGLAPEVLGGRLGRYGPSGPDGPVPVR